jgi:hypothetical protein
VRQLGCLILAGTALYGAPARAQTAEIVACLKDPSSDACLVVPGATQAPAPKRPLWSASVSGGIAPRDGGPTGNYQVASLHRQIGRSYIQVSALHYRSTLVQGDTSVTSNYGVGTVGFGGNYNGWVLDTYASLGRQSFGDIRYPFFTRPNTGITGSPYVGAGISFGRMFGLGPRLYLTPTGSAAYAWSRLLRPLGAVDAATSEPTWTTAARLRLDWLPGGGYASDRRTYLGVGVAGLWSNNATSLIGGTGSGGGDNGGNYDGTLSSRHIHDTWAEVEAHASVAVSPTLRVEGGVARTLGLISGNATTVSIGLRRSF